jgi:hypothetical protein
MAPLRRTSKSMCGLMRFRTAIMCVAALSMLWARSVATHFPHSSHSFAVHTAGDHDHRQLFDHEDSQLASAPASPRLAPPPAISSQAIYAVATFVEFENGGWHYNRPPPIG